jgi:hypothetical protein
MALRMSAYHSRAGPLMRGARSLKNRSTDGSTFISVR